MTKINHLARCAFQVFRMQVLQAGSCLAVWAALAGLTQECQAVQNFQHSSLKQARDPYYNPKLQADAVTAQPGKEKRIVNPLFATKRDATQSIQTVEKNVAKETNRDVVRTLPRWEPPIPKSSNIAVSASSNKNPPDKLKTVPAQSGDPTDTANGMAANSIIRNTTNNPPRQIVGDFSADLSRLNRTTSTGTLRPTNSGGTSLEASNQAAANPGGSNPGASNSGEFSSTDFIRGTANEALQLSRSPSSTPSVPLEPSTQSLDHSLLIPDSKINRTQNNSASELKLNAKHADSKSLELGSSTAQDSPGGNLLFKTAETNQTRIANNSTLLENSPATISSTASQSNPNPNLEPTRLLAMVGDEPIFVGDMLFELNQMIEKHMGSAPESFKERERQNGIAMLLNKYIDSKLLYIDTLRKLPEGADVEKIIDQAAKEFDKTAAPAMMKEAGITSLADFDAYLRMSGSSHRKLRLHWSKDQLTRYFMSQELGVDEEVSHRELLEVYQKNQESYAIPAKARWEQITVRFDRTASREEAERLLVEMGNKIVYGANFASVAKKGSHGFSASRGGLHDWIAKDELASKELDEAIFSEEVGKLSDKIETAEGFHIIRVVERTEASYTPFVDAQVKIKENLLSKKRAAAFEKHLTKLRQEIPVVRYDQQGMESVRLAETINP